jgi:hypothetical protein
MAAFVLACAGGKEPLRTPLDLTAAGDDVEAISAEFASRISARYGAAPEADVTTDLVRAGFTCRKVAPVEARTDYLALACNLPRPHGLCSDRFIVDLRHAGGADASASRVRPEGRFLRTCRVPSAG